MDKKFYISCSLPMELRKDENLAYQALILSRKITSELIEKGKIYAYYGLIDDNEIFDKLTRWEKMSAEEKSYQREAIIKMTDAYIIFGGECDINSETYEE